jgi:hypothetical protein
MRNILKPISWLKIVLISLFIIGLLGTSVVLSSIQYSVTIPNSGVISSSQITAASGSAADIQAAINGVIAAGGGTVNIPAGDWNFGSQEHPVTISGAQLSTLPSNAWITITGVNYNTTTTTQNGVSIQAPATILRASQSYQGYGSFFNVGDYNWANPSKHVRFSHLTLLGNVASDTAGDTGFAFYSVDGFVVQNCWIDNNPNAGVFTQYSKGVIANCSITQYYQKVLNGIWGYGVALGGNCNYHANGCGTATWISNVDDVIGKYDWDGITLNYNDPWTDGSATRGQGTTSHISYSAGPVYIESCFFDYTRHPASSSGYAYYVFRYNTVKHAIPANSPSLQWVDQHGQGFPAGRFMEVYGNTLEGGIYSVVFRAGGGLVFNNSFAGTMVGVQAADETWRANDPQNIQDVWVWNNNQNGVGVPLRIGDKANLSGGVHADTVAYLFEDSSQVAGYPTAQYVKPNYTPFPYPHPLVI